MFSLETLGWSLYFKEQINDNGINNNRQPARVAVENKGRYILYSEQGTLAGEVTGKLLYGTEDVSLLPKTGDWVLGDIYPDEQKMIIHKVLERRTKFSRKAAGSKTSEQVIAVNIDLLFIVQSCNANFSIPRLSRYLTLALESGAEPVTILSKADLDSDYMNRKAEVEKSFPGIKVITASINGDGLQDIKELISPGTTAAFIGSSGVGKSTLINMLLGSEVLETKEIREADQRGRHTTVRREMLLLPGGGIVIDTPGMRELQLWSSESGFSDLFHDIEELAQSCKYSDCTHTIEKGCAILKAAAEGKISASALKDYMKLRKELDYLEQRQNDLYRAKRKEWEKKIARFQKEYTRFDKRR